MRAPRHANPIVSNRAHLNLQKFVRNFFTCPRLTFRSITDYPDVFQILLHVGKRGLESEPRNRSRLGWDKLDASRQDARRRGARILNLRNSSVDMVRGLLKERDRFFS